MTGSHAQAMQTTGNFDNPGGKTSFGVTQGVFDNVTAFDTSDHLLNLNAHRSENAIEKLVFSGEFPLFGLLLGLVGDNAWRFIALEPSILAESGAGWIGKLLGIGQLLVMRFAWLGAAEIQHPLGLGVDQHEVLLCMRFFLPL